MPCSPRTSSTERIRNENFKTLIFISRSTAFKENFYMACEEAIEGAIILDKMRLPLSRKVHDVIVML